MLALAMHIDEQFTQFAQHTLANGAPIHPTDRAAIGSHLACQKHMAGFIVQGILRQE